MRICKHWEPLKHSIKDILKCYSKIQGGIVKSVQVSCGAFGTENGQKKNKQINHQQLQNIPDKVKGYRHKAKVKIRILDLNSLNNQILKG